MIPNAADDPFGAMNAMAAVGTVQRAPEIVIVNDGKGVENVGKRSTGMTAVLVGVPALLFLIVGMLLGSRGTNASSFNSGIDDAKTILGDEGKQGSISQLKKTLSSIDTLLERRKKFEFAPDEKGDKELLKLVKDLAVKEDYFKMRQGALDPNTLGEVVQFYAGIIEVKSLLDAHLAGRNVDNNVFTKNKEKEESETVQAPTEGRRMYALQRYGVLLFAPLEGERTEDFGARIVELGGYHCDGETKKAPVSKCPEGTKVTHLAYRKDVKEIGFDKSEVAQTTTDTVPAKKVLEILPSNVRDQFFKGAQGVATEAYYSARLKIVFELICKRDPKDAGKCLPSTLLELGNRVQTKVEAASKQGTKFTFLM